MDPQRERHDAGALPFQDVAAAALAERAGAGQERLEPAEVDGGATQAGPHLLVGNVQLAGDLPRGALVGRVQV